jgi:hypothetical protein
MNWGYLGPNSILGSKHITSTHTYLCGKNITLLQNWRIHGNEIEDKNREVGSVRDLAWGDIQMAFRILRPMYQTKMWNDLQKML